MQKNNFYTNAHLFTAAVRILGEQKKQPPTAEDVCALLKWSLEQGRLVLRRMVEAGILELTTQAFEDRIFIKDHLAIETYKDAQKVDQLDQALKKFQGSTQGDGCQSGGHQIDPAKKTGQAFCRPGRAAKSRVGKKETMTSDAAYFISDAHLGDQLPYPPQRQADLVDFLSSVGNEMTHLYILGDLFDFWIEYRHGIRPDFFPILHCFRTLVEKGVQVEYVCGNHDFSFGPFLTDKIGIRIHDEPITVKLQGRQLHLVHGDGIIQNDVSQRLLKKLLRNRLLHNCYYLLHPTLGVGLGESISMASRRRSSQTQTQNTITPTTGPWPKPCSTNMTWY